MKEKPLLKERVYSVYKSKESKMDLFEPQSISNQESSRKLENYVYRTSFPCYLNLSLALRNLANFLSHIIETWKRGIFLIRSCVVNQFYRSFNDFPSIQSNQNLT